ncbi:hybrid sensor histidine kinase/response regulator [Flavobacterium difficile]|uniref:histidine kinase n=1 Tax=Flavobacterium difficile TaxID=2709659 RepID=A0ABX0I470_9FLAO|nr:hybrid sensor histidine kinase/response regulator [Flavobacterium difficile]NHM01986.1 response regulator [Flavobacterium difficile]
MKRKFLLFFILFGVQFLLGQVNLDVPFEKKSIHTSTYIYNAKQKKLTINEIVKIPIAQFQKLKNENQDLGFTNDHYWLHFKLKNTSTKPTNYYLETARPIIDYAELYSIESGKVIDFQKSGDAIPFSERSFHHRKIIFKIQLKPYQQLSYYIHMKSDGEVINVPVLLRSDTNLIENTSFEQIVFGFFYGILLITAILYLFFYFTMKEKVFLYYSLYVVFIGLLQFSLDGYFYEYIQPNASWFSKKSVLIFAIISGIFLGSYSQNYLKIQKVKPPINLFFYVLYGLLILLLLTILFLPDFFNHCYPIMNLLGLILLVLIIYSLVNVYIKTKKSFFLFSIGLSFLIIGFVVFILKNFSILPINFITENGSKFGTGLEVVFYSLTMANLIGDLKEDKIKSQEIALKKSREMNELKSHFLSNISHELRTPLNTILNVSALLTQEKEITTVQEKSELIKYSSQNLLSAVNDILDFSKIENNEFHLENQPTNVLNLATEIAKLYSVKAQEKGLTFEFNSDVSLPKEIVVDTNRLQQVLNNLLQNALKFTESGGIKFTIEGKLLSNKKVKIRFKISDTGVGIHAEKLESIFDSFSQETINDKRKFGGLGLGLFIVKNVVDKYNGKINFESEVGKGSSCTIQLKLDYLESKKAIENVTPIDSNKQKILIVEDNKMNQMVLKMIFKNWQNATFEIANNGQEALDLLKNNHFDIVLMDLQMPVMDGYEATIAIRSGLCGQEKSNTPIIAITADVTEPTKEKVKSIGMNYYMTKPVDKKSLYDKINELTKK